MFILGLLASLTLVRCWSRMVNCVAQTLSQYDEGTEDVRHKPIGGENNGTVLGA